MLRLIGWGSSGTATCESIFVHWRSSYYNMGIVILPLPSQGRRVRTQWQTGKSLSTVKSPSAFPVLNPSSREFKFANLSELRYVGTYQTCFMTSKKTATLKRVALDNGSFSLRNSAAKEIVTLGNSASKGIRKIRA